MAAYRSFIHVQRLDETKIDMAMFLHGKIYCFPKLDGTNALAWADKDGKIHCGSRKREVTVEHDNANFMNWFTTDVSTEDLRGFLVEHPNLIVYFEWLAGVDGMKQAGNIKQYLDPGAWVIAVFDSEKSQYINYDEYAKFLDGIYDKIDRPLVVLDKPSYDDLIEVLNSNHYNLPHDVLGEGIVTWNYDFYDQWGNFQVAKIVAQEFYDNKGKAKRERQAETDENVEENIVNAFISSADCEKCKQKVLVALGLEEWNGSNKEIGIFLNMLYTDLIQEEMLSIVRRFKNPVIRFNELKNVVFVKGRKYLGLI